MSILGYTDLKRLEISHVSVTCRPRGVRKLSSESLYTNTKLNIYLQFQTSPFDILKPLTSYISLYKMLNKASPANSANPKTPPTRAPQIVITELQLQQLRVKIALTWPPQSSRRPQTPPVALCVILFSGLTARSDSLRFQSSTRHR